MQGWLDESEVFRRNMLSFMKIRGLSAAGLSRKAGLNPRAVKDIEERRTGSPRLSTVFNLARALEVPVEVLLGLDQGLSLEQSERQIRPSILHQPENQEFTDTPL
ncbi:helix-turn-helix transcriptional regulator [Roseinatronobacter sp.]